MIFDNDRQYDQEDMWLSVLQLILFNYMNQSSSSFNPSQSLPDDANPSDYQEYFARLNSISTNFLPTKVAKEEQPVQSADEPYEPPQHQLAIDLEDYNSNFGEGWRHSQYDYLDIVVEEPFYEKIMKAPDSRQSMPCYELKESRPVLNIEVEVELDIKNSEMKKGAPKQTKDLLKGYGAKTTSMLKRIHGEHDKIARFQSVRGDNFKHVHELLGFTEESNKSNTDRVFVEDPDAEGFQKSCVEYSQSNELITDVLLYSRGNIASKLLRIKYADRFERLMVLGPGMQSWK